MKIAVINCSPTAYNLATDRMKTLFRQEGHEVFFSTRADMWSRGCEKAYLSAIFTWDLPVLLHDASLLGQTMPVEVGGPAVTAMPEFVRTADGDVKVHTGLDERWEHIKGDFQATFTSRGCPRSCEFCLVNKLEGRKMIEYDDFTVPVGVNPYICDNNLLSTSWQHQQLVVDKHRAVSNLDINSGFDDRIFIKDPDRYWELYRQLYIECYSEDTEVLTNNGFKLFSELRPEEQVATLNKDGFLEYQSVTTRYGYPYKGEMIQFRGRSYDFLVTPRHQMYVRPYHQNWQLREANLVTKTSEIKRNLKWQGRHRQTYLVGGKEYSMNLWLKFFGWWLAEGSATIGYHKNGVISGYQVTIHQKKEENLNEIREIIAEMGFHVGPQKDRVVFNNKELCLELIQFGHQSNRFIPISIRMLPPEQLQIIFRSLIKGDGSQIRERYFYFTTSKRLASDVAEIALKLGYCVTIGKVDPKTTIKKNGQKIQSKLIKYALSISRQNESPRLLAGQQRTNYQGMVYCVDVPNHTLLVKRNGKIAWSGNCWRFAYDMPEQKEAITFIARWLTNKGIDYRHIIVFCLAGGPGMSFGESRQRLQYLIDIGCSPYPMRYRPLDSLEMPYTPPGWRRNWLDLLFSYYGVPYIWRSCSWEQHLMGWSDQGKISKQELGRVLSQ